MLWDHPAPVTRYSKPCDITDKFDAVVTSILSDAVVHDAKSEAPAVALAPSPGSGKTTRTQKILAEQPRETLGRDAVLLAL